MGRAWLRIIEPTTTTAPNPQPPKARSLARNDAVELDIDTGQLRSRVTHDSACHQVSIDIPQWTKHEQSVVTSLVTKAGATARHLAAGDLPDTLADQRSRRDVHTAPGRLDKPGVRCTCSSRRFPCLHVLATLYALCRQLDEEPALSLTLRMPPVAAPLTEVLPWVKITDIAPATFFDSCS